MFHVQVFLIKLINHVVHNKLGWSFVCSSGSGSGHQRGKRAAPRYVCHQSGCAPGNWNYPGVIQSDPLEGECPPEELKGIFYWRPSTREREMNQMNWRCWGESVWSGYNNINESITEPTGSEVGWIVCFKANEKVSISSRRLNHFDRTGGCCKSCW